MRVLGRGRVAHWSKEKLSAMTTIELRQLLANAQRLQETQVAELCNELLSERPRGHAVVRKLKPKTGPRRPGTGSKATG